MKLNVLLVEDNEADVIITSEILKMAGLDSEVMVVTDGEQVLDYLLKKGIYSESKIPELIILDINIPKIDGR